MHSSTTDGGFEVGGLGLGSSKKLQYRVSSDNRMALVLLRLAGAPCQE